MGLAPNDHHDRLGQYGGAQWEKLFATLLDATGLAPHASFTSLVHCHPPKDRKVKAIEVQACRTWLRDDVWEGAPKVIVALGQEALEGILNAEAYRPTKPRYPLAEYHGTVVGTWLDIPVVGAYHPSGAARNTKTRRALVGDLQAIAGLLGVVSPKPCDEWFDFIPLMGPDHVYAVDIETDRQGAILGVGMAWREGEKVLATYVPWHPDHAEQWEECWLGNTLVFHNAKFDAPILAANGIRMWNNDGIHDTMLQAYVLRREQFTGSLGLKELASADLGLTWPTIEQLGLPEEMSPEEIAGYCVQDSAATLLLYELYSQELEDERL